tara:strand:+ start:1446 stop:1736 length:291 start_codon:yes stop_codon:yes gene_type:complete
LNNNLKKIDIIKNLSNKIGFSQNISKKIVNDLIDIIIENIKNDNMNLKNIGNFKLIIKKERLGRNPKTKEEFTITPRKSVSFTASKNILAKFKESD